MSSQPSQLSHPLIVVSDIHLKHLEDERGQLLLDLIKRVDHKKTEYFVLLGDIFDFCLGSHRYFKKKFAKLGRALSQLSGQGVKVLFIEGNHEFAIEGLGWPGVEFVNKPSYEITLKSGAKIAFSHGDLLAPDKKYLAFRGLVKSKSVTLVSATLVPGYLLDQYSLTHAKVSRMRHEDMDLCHERVKKGVEKWAEEVPATHYIFGHFHIPYAERLNANSTMASLDSWDKPNALLLTAQDELERVFFEEPKANFKVEPARPFLLDH